MLAFTQTSYLNKTEAVQSVSFDILSFPVLFPEVSWFQAQASLSAGLATSNVQVVHRMVRLRLEKAACRPCFICVGHPLRLCGIGSPPLEFASNRFRSEYRSFDALFLDRFGSSLPPSSGWKVNYIRL